MAGPIQRFPFGLTELLQIKGQSPPNVLGNAVVPMLDATAFYKQTLTTSASTAIGGNINTAAGLSTQQIIGGPSAAMPWWVHGIGCTLTVGAAPGTFAEITAGIRSSNGSPFIALETFSFRSRVAGDVIAFGFPLPVPLVLQAGAIVEGRVRGDAAGADHQLSVNCLFAFLDR